MKQALIFAGTTEGRRLAQALAQAGIPASVCVATEYGETLLPVGAAVSAEPGIYLPGKFGVRIEDVTVLTADGCIDITKSPKELIIL